MTMPNSGLSSRSEVVSGRNARFPHSTIQESKGAGSRSRTPASSQEPAAVPLDEVSVEWTQLDLFGDKADRTAYLYHAVKRNPELAAALSTYIRSGEEAGDREVRDQQDRMVESHYEMRSNEALVPGGIAAIAATAIATLTGTALLGVFGVEPAMAGALFLSMSFIPPILLCGRQLVNRLKSLSSLISDKPATMREFDPSRVPGSYYLKAFESAVKECANDEVLTKKLKTTEGWQPGQPAAEFRSQELEKQTSQKAGFGGKVKGVLNVVRNLPKIATLPIINAVAKPISSADEARNERIAKYLFPAALLAPVAAGAGPALAAALFSLVGPTVAGTCDGLLNVGRKTQEKVAERSQSGFFAEVATGYEQAFSSAYRKGVAAKPSHPLPPPRARFDS